MEMDKRLHGVTNIICSPMSYQEGPVRDGVLGALAMTRGERFAFAIDQNGIRKVIDLDFDTESPVVKMGIAEAAKLGQKAFDMNGIDNLISSFPQGHYKIVVEVFGESVIAVAVRKGHVVNKSLRRIVKRAARKVGMLRAAPAANDTPTPRVDLS